MINMTEVVVLDVETTGIGSSHQIVEAAGVIYETEFGEVIGEFDTLIRPTRSIDADATRQHGLRASDLSMAPTFEEVGPMLARLLHRRPVIGYDVKFDADMLNSEFKRNGIDFQITQMSCALSPFGTQISLMEAATRIGHKLENWHQALQDARAALAISAHHGWELMVTKAGRNEHMSNTKVGAVRTLSRYQAGLTNVYDLKPFSRLSEFRDPTVEEGYLLLLDEFLKDKSFSQDEIDELDQYAEKHQLLLGMRHELHRTYFGAIESAAKRGGVTQDEARLLMEYANLLEIDVEITVTETGQFVPAPGALICQTGDSFFEGRVLTKSEVSEIVESRGYRFTDDLRKADGVALLLIADLGHESNKTRKAEDWGIPMMTIEMFIQVTNAS
jgi:DNA polymerase-3 subunit epsilon